MKSVVVLIRGHQVNEVSGGVAEWLCSGLQSRLRRFDSDPRLQNRVLMVDQRFKSVFKSGN